MEMVEKIKNFWHDQIPVWLPIAVSILGAAFYVGQQQQSIVDRLTNLEKQVIAIQDYLRTNHTKNDPPPPISALQLPQEDAGGLPAVHY